MKISIFALATLLSVTSFAIIEDEQIPLKEASDILCKLVDKSGRATRDAQITSTRINNNQIMTVSLDFIDSKQGDNHASGTTQSVSTTAGGGFDLLTYEVSLSKGSSGKMFSGKKSILVVLDKRDDLVIDTKTMYATSLRTNDDKYEDISLPELMSDLKLYCEESLSYK